MQIQDEMEERERDGNCLFVGRGDPGPCGRGVGYTDDFGNLEVMGMKILVLGVLGEEWPRMA